MICVENWNRSHVINIFKTVCLKIICTYVTVSALLEGSKYCVFPGKVLGSGGHAATPSCFHGSTTPHRQVELSPRSKQRFSSRCHVPHISYLPTSDYISPCSTPSGWSQIICHPQHLVQVGLGKEVKMPSSVKNDTPRVYWIDFLLN